MAGFETKKNSTQISGQQVTRNNIEKITHDFDELKMYFGKPFDVGNGMTIYQPTIGQILNIGEEKFYSTLYIFVGNPTMFRLQLWDMGVDWNKITSYDLFMSTITGINKEVSDLLFGDLDFSGFALYGKNIEQINDDGETEIIQIPTLYSQSLDIEISKDDYTIISEYLQVMFNIHPKVERAKGRATKEAIIEEDRMNLAMRQKEKQSGSILLPLISSCLNHPGFKYKLNELEDVGICYFMDSVQRLQVYESSTAVMKGMYSGFVDGSKIKPENYNWMRSLNNNS